MSFYSFDGKVPSCGRDCFIADSADIIGDVHIGDRCYIGFGAVIRADYGTITLGSDSAVEEGCICHAKPGGHLVMGKRITLGHGAVIHGKELGNNVVVGMGAVVGFDTIIGEGAVIAEGAVLKARMIIPPNKLAGGVPARVFGDIDGGQRTFIDQVKTTYIRLAETYAGRLQRIEIKR
jgi:carbonic anhydrase/acetyltransferase-like protein (isoleucine patch superfamily)